MVLGVTAASGVAIGSWLWGYNRENYKFDRELRQKNEFKILDFRNAQSQLWREDIRDIISLTEKKMDAYLIISVLQLDACLGLFTEGRLEPGTPPWLLQLYMMTLGAAFMFLLMSAWFAMHASVVAQCSSVRLLTQFVRLPIPTWGEVEDMRTYASSYEHLHPGHWLRVPFMKSMASKGKVELAPAAKPKPEGGATSKKAGRSGKSSKTGKTTSTARGSASSGFWADPSDGKTSSASTEAALHADPWLLEDNGDQRRLYELKEEDPALRRHVVLARKAATQYQCFDAFARVSMTFGTNQFLSAIGYYALGYVAVQDGAPWVAWGVVVTMACIAIAMLGIDFSLTRCESVTLQCLIVLALGGASAATFLFQVPGPIQNMILRYLLPIVYLANAMWLWRALKSCGITMQANGALLPMKFRAVLYLDVFGWLSKTENGKYVDECPAPAPDLPTSNPVSPDEDLPEAMPPPNWPVRTVGPSGQIEAPPEHVWLPSSYCPHHPPGTPDTASALIPEDDAVVTGHERIQPGRLAAYVFRASVWLLVFLWISGMFLNLELFNEQISSRLVADVFLEEAAEEDAIGSGMHVTVGEDVGGMPELMPVVTDYAKLPPLPGQPELVKVTWPSHSSFIPRALSSSSDGREIVISDDFNVYFGRMKPINRYPALRGLVLGQPNGGAAIKLQPIETQTKKLESEAGSVAGAIHNAWDSLTAAFQTRPTSTDARGDGVAVVTPPSYELQFDLSGACPALAGQAIKDIATVCVGNKGDENCRLIALTDHGRTLHECALAPEANHSAHKKGVLPKTNSWIIAQDWLRHVNKESVQSIAINTQCAHEGDEGQMVLNPAPSGCVVVGTSSGRLVQLRGSSGDKGRLIPERVLHQREHPSARGSLTYLDGEYLLALWSKMGSISSFSAATGALVKEWRLPEHAKWLMLTRGGPNLYSLGARQNGEVELYRFPIPPELSIPEDSSSDENSD